MTLQGASLDDLPQRIASVRYAMPDFLPAFNNTSDPEILVSYSFQADRPADLPASAWTDVSGWGVYNEAEKAAVRSALLVFEDYLNVRFVEQATEEAVDLTFLRASAGVPGGRAYHTYMVFDGVLEFEGFAAFDVDRNLTEPSQTWLILHEIGHALGLKHPGNYDVIPALAPPGPYLPTAEDNYKFTVMSYTANPETGITPDSLMLYDVAALQAGWGQNVAASAGNDSYAPRPDGGLFVISDGGGNDTVRPGGFVSVSIDLREWRFSNFGGQDSIAIAYGTEIENAEGTAGNDTLIGNAGANVLVGAAGFDTLIGGDGNDTLHSGPNPAGQGDILLGGPGNDIYHVDSPLDFVDEGNVAEFAGLGFGGFDAIVSTADFFWDLYSVAESLIIAEAAFDPEGDGVTGVGSVFDNRMTGNSHTNILFGRGGSDIYQPGDGVDYLSLSTLGLTDENAYAGVDGVNTVIVTKRESGAFSYDIVFEYESGKDRLDVSDYGYASGSEVLARGVDDGAGSSYFILGDGLDYLYLVGVGVASVTAGDFIV